MPSPIETADSGSTGNPSPFTRPDLNAGWRGFRRSLPRTLQEALLSRRSLIFALGSGLAGWALTRLLAASPLLAGGSMRPAAWVMAAAFLLNLVLLSLRLAGLPEPEDAGCPALSAWLRWAMVVAGAWTGLGLAASESGFRLPATLAALTLAQGAALGGLAGLLSRMARGRTKAVRLGLTLALALLATGLLWSRPFLIEMYQEPPKSYRTASAGLMALGPVTATATAWSETGSGCDLLRSGTLYDRWLGNEYPWSYPALWPARNPEKSWDAVPGLILGMLLWGVALLGLSDVLGTAELKDKR